MNATFRILMVVAVLLVPRAASAEWFLFPFAAMNTGGDTTRDSGSFGGAFGWIGRIVGVEGEAAMAPNFFDAGGGFRTDHSQTTYTVSALVGPRVGMWRTYGLIGAGLLRSKIEEVGGFAQLSDDRAGLHVGGGLMWNATPHIGLRGDARYIRAMDDEEPEGNVFAERLANFSSWRIGGGVTVRW